MQVTGPSHRPRASVHSSDTAPILLFGATRSGTTLLSLMLGHHPQVAFVGELEWVWDHAAENGGETQSSPAEFEDRARAQRHFLYHRPRVDHALAFDELVLSIVAQMRQQADPFARKARYGCQIHRHYAQALAVWPDAPVIHIVRDGRDVCSSWKSRGWIGNAYQAGLSWCEAIAEWEALKPTLDPTRYRELRFEDLIRDPVGELRRLCELLEVPYDQAMLRYHEHSTYDPVDPEQGAKWRTQMSSREIRVFEAVAGSVLEQHGYPASGQPEYLLHPWMRPALLLEDKVLHHRARVKTFGYRLYLADLVTRRVGPRWLRDRVRLGLNAIEQARVK